jgi:hypothetical protein
VFHYAATCCLDGYTLGAVLWRSGTLAALVVGPRATYYPSIKTLVVKELVLRHSLPWVLVPFVATV